MSRGAIQVAAITVVGCALAIAAGAHGASVAVTPERPADFGALDSPCPATRIAASSGLNYSPKLAADLFAFGSDPLRETKGRSLRFGELTDDQATGVGEQLYLQCWEDRFARPADRNEKLLIEIKIGDDLAASPLAQPLLIPLPPAAWPGLAGLLAGIWGSRGRRRRA